MPLELGIRPLRLEGLRAGFVHGDDLLDRRLDVVGLLGDHRLHHHGIAPADDYIAHPNRPRLPPQIANLTHESNAPT